MKLILRAVTSPYDDITKGSVLSHQELDTNQINLKGELIYTANSENNVITFQKINGGTIQVPFISGSGGTSTFITGGTYSNGTTELTNNTGGSISITGYSTGYTLTSNEIVDVLDYTPLSADTFVTGGTYSDGTAIFTNNINETFNVGGFFTALDDIHTTGFTFDNGNYNLTIFNSDNTSFTQNLGILSSDMTITGGTYNPNTGVGTFVNNSGGTFDVSGFLTGQTDTFIVSGTSNNYTGTLTLRRSDNVNITITGFTSGTSMNWYAENTNPPATRPVATGAGSVAFGNIAQALGSDMFVYGTSAGGNGFQSNFIGPFAGNGATSAAQSNFFGPYAGFNSTNANNSNFFGRFAGQSATNAYQANFMGNNAGFMSTGANNGNFFGQGAGYQATNAAFSNFLGYNSGYQATNASYSNLFGYNVGRNMGGNNIGSNNIIIGTNISLPNGTSNALNLGGILFGTGAYSTISVTPSVTGQTNGRIGIGIVTPLEKLHVSGNTRVEGGFILRTLTGGTSINNLGIDVNGNVVSGETAYNIFRYLSNNQIVTGTTGGIYRGDSISVTGATAYFNSTRNNGTSLGASMGHIGSIGNTNVSSYLQLFSNTANGTTGPNIIIGSYSGSSSTEAQLNFSATKDGGYNAFGTASTNTLLFSFRDGYFSPIAKFNIGTDFIDFLSYPTTRVDTGTTSNYLATDSSGRLTSKPISGIVFTGGTVTGNTNFTGNLSANTLTSTNIKITLPTITGSTGEIVYFGTGSGLSAGLIYYFNSSGQWTVANATTSTSSKYLIGIALGSSITDGMLIRGYAKYSVGNYSSVGTGDILYLGTTNGFFQTTAPSSSSEVVRVIGYCIDSANDIIYFNPDNTWVEIL